MRVRMKKWSTFGQCAVFLVTAAQLVLLQSCGFSIPQNIKYYIAGFRQQVDSLYLQEVTQPNGYYHSLLSYRYGVGKDGICWTDSDEGCAALCERYGDTHYNKRLYQLERVDRYTATFCTDRVDSIQITAAIDVDAAHPAGASLNDLFYVFTVTPEDYIRRGYKTDDALLEYTLGQIPAWLRKKITEDNLYLLNNTLTPIYGRADDVNLPQYELLGWQGRLLELYSERVTPSEDLGLKVRVYFRSGQIVEAVRGN